MPQTISKPANTTQPLLFQGSNDNHFSLALGKGMELVSKYPEVLELIAADQHAHALEKKKIRELDADWRRSQGGARLFPDDQNDKTEVTSVVNATGRKPMPPRIVFLFLLARGYLGSIKDKRAYSFIKESKFLEAQLIENGINHIPGASTILDNVNCLSESTLRAALKVTIGEGLVLGADDYKKLYADSTRSSADSAWPTESRTISDLMRRIHNGFGILRQNSINVNLSSGTEELLSELKSCDVSIALNTGKKGSKKHTKKMYNKILRATKKLLEIFEKATIRARSKIGNILPSLKNGLEALVESIEVDLHNVQLCADNARSRVIQGKQVPAAQKVLGIADPDAEIIAKGSKPPVFGYKPQICRSAKGFIVGLLVPQGSAADSDQMKPITDSAIKNTTVQPEVISYDDGYTNSKARNEYLEAGIKVVSFSGSKGKGILEDEWDLPEYQEARNQRSMVESTISILKGFFRLGRFTRRGRERVTQELLTAAIFHNVALLQRLTS